MHIELGHPIDPTLPQFICSHFTVTTVLVESWRCFFSFICLPHARRVLGRQGDVWSSPRHSVESRSSAKSGALGRETIHVCLPTPPSSLSFPGNRYQPATQQVNQRRCCEPLTPWIRSGIHDFFYFRPYGLGSGEIYQRIDDWKQKLGWLNLKLFCFIEIQWK